MALRLSQDTPLRLLLWNANGIRREALEFAHTLKTEDIDIALISETKIQDDSPWHMPGYDIYKTQGQLRGHGGTAIAIKNTITHTQTYINGHENIQLTEIETYTNRRMTVGAIYVPPSKDLKAEDLDLLTINHANFIYGGDFNAKHPDWNSRTTNQKGKVLQRHSERHRYEVSGPISPTSTPHNGPGDVIDIFLMQPQITINTIEVMYALNSDHGQKTTNTKQKPHKHVHKGNWHHPSHYTTPVQNTTYANSIIQTKHHQNTLYRKNTLVR